MESNIAIVVSGGPAPGINGVISAAALEAHNRGLTIKGVLGGFKSLISQGTAALSAINIKDVANIYNQGGIRSRNSAI